MAQRKKRKSRKGKPNIRTRRGKRAVGVTALLVVDQEPHLKKALSRCRRLRTELHKKQERLRLFEEDEMSAYQQWFHSEFGGLLTEIRERQERLSSLQFVYDEVDFCLALYPEKAREVHAELMRRLEEGTLHAFVPPGDEGKENSDEDDDLDDEEWDDLDDEDLDEDDDEDWDDLDDDEGPGFPGQMPTRPRQPDDPRVKALYRVLAKRLHPDHSDLESPLRERRWNELQAAYRERDIESLQRIEAVCDMDTTGLSIEIGLARLRDLTVYHQSHVEPVRGALRQAKRHPAFDFKKADRKKMRAEAADELESKSALLHQRIQLMRVMIDAMVREKPKPFAVAGGSVPSAFYNPANAKRSDKDIWENHEAWREKERQRSAAESANEKNGI